MAVMFEFTIRGIFGSQWVNQNERESAGELSLDRQERLNSHAARGSSVSGGLSVDERVELKLDTSLSPCGGGVAG